MLKIRLRAEARRRYLDDHCDDPALRGKVEALLAAHDEATGVLDASLALGPVDETSPKHDSGAASASELPGDLLGTILGPYRIDAVIGEGGMGTVYAATQRRPIRRRVALKVIKIGMDTREVVARFESERQALALMDHPNIATVHDGGLTDSGRPYFVMELVDGEPITSSCDRHRLGVRQRIRLFLPICRAVQHAHQKGVIHRDLKPHNLLVQEIDGEPVAKVIDFGIAKALDEKLTTQTLVTGRGLLLGTPEYMSPEQAAARPDLDTRTDVYALGIVLYELLVGALPFETDGGLLAILNQVLRHEPPPMSRRLAALDDAAAIAAARSTSATGLGRVLAGDLERVVAKAIAKRPMDRYASASELAADIERHLADEPVLAGSPSTFYRLGKFVRRHRLEVAATMVVVILSVAFGLTMAVQSSRLSAALHGVERERDRALEVSRFLVELFSFGDPAQTAGYDPPASEILERGVEQIGERLGDDPEIRAALLANFAEIYTHLGKLDEAIAMGRESLALRRALGGESRAEVADSGYHLTNALIETGELVEAEELARESLGLRAAVFGASSLERAQSLVTLGQVHFHRGDALASESAHREALAIRRDLLPEEDLRIGSSMAELALAYWGQDRLPEAAAMFERALDHGHRHLDADHVLIAVRLKSLGQVLVEQGELERGEATLRDAVERLRRIFGDGHARVLSAESALAGCLNAAGRLDEAEGLYRRVLDGRRRVLRPNHPDLAVDLISLGTLARQRGDLDAAIMFYREALPILEASYGTEHWRYGTALQNLGVALWQQGDLETARTHFERALAVLRSSSKAEGHLVGEVLSSLGVIARRQGDNERAIAIYRQALRVMETRLGREHWRTANVVQNLAVALRETGDLGAAEEHLRRAVDAFRASLGDRHQRTGMALGSLGLLRCLRGDPNEGLEQLGDAASILAERLGAEHWRLAANRFRRGQCHALGGRLGIGEPIMAEALEDLRSALGADHGRIVRAEAILAELRQAAADG
ncbi:MAG: tetratricopeptide repeat-containing serine/threonine-protein kinase [Acidobacteriota bacterium]